MPFRQNNLSPGGKADKMTDVCRDILILEDENVTAGFTTRPCSGARRRDELARGAAERGGAAVRLSLVHGIRLVRVGPGQLPDVRHGLLDYEDSDGAVTDLNNVVLTTGHGDCLPIYLYDPVVRAVGLAHAGWRGTLRNISREAVKAMIAAFSSDPADIRSYIGPGIGRCCFEVSPDVAESFREAFSWAGEHMDAAAGGKCRIDLKGINRRQLNECGLVSVETSDLCTVCREDLFYSYRRSRDSERMLAYIYLKGDR